MLWAALLLLNLAWICLFAFCRTHLSLTYNCRVAVRRLRGRRAGRRGGAKRGKRPGGNGGGRLSPDFDLVVEVWPRCHLKPEKGNLHEEPVIIPKESAGALAKGYPAWRSLILEFMELGVERWIKEKGYGLRFTSESVFSALKQRFGGPLLQGSRDMG